MADVIVLNEIDSAKEELNTKIGVTTNTGGTTTAGTLMAKLNAILSHLLTYWTSTRAGYIDTIKTNTDYLKTQRQASLTGVGATIYSHNTNCYFLQNSAVCFAKFIAPIDGIYKVTITAPAYNNGSIIFYKVIDACIGYGYMNTSDKIYAYPRSVSQVYSYNNATIGSSSLASPAVPLMSDIADYGGYMLNMLPIISELGTNTSTTSSVNFELYCRAGEPVQIVGRASDNTSNLLANSITVTYQQTY